MEHKEEPSEHDELFPKSKKSIKNFEVREVQVLSLQDAYIRVGGVGRFQAFILLMTIFQVIGPTLLMSNLVYFELKPKNYICTFTDGIVPCSLSQICTKNEDPRFIKWDIDPNVPYMQNIITDFGMICESKFGIGLIGSMYFIGEAMGSLIYIVFAKHLKQTRIRHLYARNFMLMIILSVLVLFIRSPHLLYVSIFLIGLCQSISIVQGFAYTMELMPFERRNLISMLLHLIDKVLLTITTLILKYYGSNWTHIMIPGLFCSVIASVMSIFALDSPQFHHDLGSYEKCRQLFQKICIWNGKQPLENFVFEKEPLISESTSLNERYKYQSMTGLNDQSTEEKSSHEENVPHSHNIHALPITLNPTRMFETKIEYYQLLLCILVLSTCVMDDNILHYSLKSYEGDIFNNTMTLMLSGTIAIYLAYWLMQNFHPALSLSFSFLIMSTAGFLYPSIHNLRHFPMITSNVDVSATLLLCLAKLGTGTAHSLTQLFILWQFNSKHYSFVFASSNLFARLFAILAPEIGELKEPIPMFVVAFTSAFCGFLCFLMYIHLEKSKQNPIREISLKEFDA